MTMLGKTYVIRFDAEKCVQCHGCETACKSWRGLPHGVRFRRVLNVWTGGYPAITSSSLSLACLHCVEPACMAACPAGAIARGADGRVLVDAALCVGCRMCAKACPFGVPQFGEDGIMRKCDLCIEHPTAGGEPPCVATCPWNALRMEALTAEKKSNIETTVLDLVSRSGQA